MSRILENDSKKLLMENGVAVPRHGVAHNPQEARIIAEDIGMPVVIKALVPVGRRGKSGGIRFPEDAEQTSHAVSELLNMNLANYPVTRVLVEERLDIAQELYISLFIDTSKRVPMVIASTRGGIEVEEMVKKYPDNLIIVQIDPFKGLSRYKSIEIWSRLGLAGKLLLHAGGILDNLWKIFLKYDARLLEINPLVITRQETLIAAASVMNIDDNALFRHPELSGFVQPGSERTWRPLTEREKEVVKLQESDPYRGTARYTEMDGGEIGFMCGGGGASLFLFDTIIAYGAKPANYSEFGGNPPEDKVYGLAKIILSKPGVKGFFVAQNITNNTQVDIEAYGIIRAVRDLKIDPSSFPIVVRLAGLHDDVAKRLFIENGIEYHGDDITLTEAVQLMVKKMKAK